MRARFLLFLEAETTEVGYLDYGSLIRRAWRLTWQHRFLWVLGLFAGGAVNSCQPGAGGGPVQWSVDPGSFDWYSSDLRSAFRWVSTWFADNAGLVLAVASVAAFLALVFLVLSLIAQGGMAIATAHLALGRPISPGHAWGIGLRLAWRYLVLWVLLIVLLIVVALVVAAVFLLVFALSQPATGAADVILTVLAVLLGLVVFLVAIPLFLGISVAGALAQRAIAVEDAGPLAGLQAGFRLLWNHKGASALAWLINLGLSIAAGLLVFGVFLALLIPLGALGAVVFTITEVSAVLIFYAVAALLLLVAGVWLAGAVANTFFWSYWTLVYLNLTGRLDAQLQPPRES